MIETGTCTYFNEDRFFGFILLADGRKVFAHGSQVGQGGPMRRGDVVELRVLDDTNGRWRATDVRVITRADEEQA